MRIAISNWSNRIAGGAEQYITDIGQLLLQRGHRVSLLHQISQPEGREIIPSAAAETSWNMSALGLESALDGLRRWKPDIVYCQGMLDPEIEARTQKIAPSIYFAHNYNGTCISGERTNTFPAVKTCERLFGPACLAHFYPRRCGGLNPITMIRDYRLNTDRLRVLSQYNQVITHSDYMAREFRRHEIQCETVRFFTRGPSEQAEAQCADWRPSERWRLLMITRMTSAKGGALLLDALPSIASGLAKPVTLTLAGDGPSRPLWEAKAERLRQRHPEIEISFPGWLKGREREDALGQSDLLLMPSLWPEPFGMVGPEAGHWGVPAVAFRSGGIPSWLSDGVNGCLAEEPPTPSSFREAVVRCLSDEACYRRMRAQARAAAKGMSIEGHYEDLIGIFTRVLDRSEARVLDRQEVI